MKKSLRRALSLTLALAMIFAIAALAVAADPPMGADNRTVQVTTGIRQGTYLVHNGWNSAYATNARLIGTNFNWDPATMETYVFDPSIFPDLQWHADGFPQRATYRTPVQHLGEMKYLCETYPEITNMVLAGYSNGVQTGATHNNWNAFPQYSIPIYALEICSAPGVMDGRPASLHQCGNHGGEVDSNEMGMNLAWYLCTKYGVDAQVTELVNTTRIYILPYTNPDGNMMTFRSASGNHRTNARGVDPNRNWAYRWGSNTGSTGTPGTGATYRGASPNSEPETKGISSIYRRDNVISSVSGHTSGQIVIYAWSYTRNPEDGHPLLTKLAKQQTDLNGHTPQNGHVMYAQSGEINDYLWGSMRALGFTYEYGTTQTGSYLGAQTGNNYVTADYIDAAGRPKVVQANYSTVSGSGRPAADVTGKLVALPDEFIALGYQDLAAGARGNGLNNPALGGPLLAARRITVAMIQAELNKDADFIRGKVFLSHIPSSAAIGNSIAQLLKDNGGVGWIVTSTTSDGGYSLPGSVGYGTTAFPVAVVTKGYAAELHEKSKQGTGISLTFKADQKDVTSVDYLWYREKPAYLLNISFAKEYANHIKGTIKDAGGQLIPQVALNASLEIEGKILTTSGAEAPAAQQWKETHTPRYDVVGGVYDWSILPSKQSEYPDKGWDITASANGKYNVLKNVKFPVDTAIAIARGQDPAIFADPMYQQTVDNVDFVLPDAITVDFDFDQVLNAKSYIEIPFSTYIMTAGGLDSAKGKPDGAVTATVNGYNTTVVDLGGGEYKAVFNPFGTCGVTATGEVDFVIEISGANVLPHSAYTNTLVFGSAHDYTVYFKPSQTDLIIGDSFEVDVMLKGISNYTGFTADVTYNPALLQCTGYGNMTGFVTACSPTAPNTIGIRCIPSTNMVLGAPCADVKIVTLKFTVLGGFTGDDVETALSFATVTVNPPAGNLFTGTAPSPPLDLILRRPVLGNMANVALITGSEVEIEFDEVVTANNAQQTFSVLVDGQKVEYEFLSYFDFGSYATRKGVVNIRLKDALDAGEPRGRRRESNAESYLARTEDVKGPIAAARIRVEQRGLVPTPVATRTAVWQPFYMERSLGNMSRLWTWTSAKAGNNGTQLLLTNPNNFTSNNIFSATAEPLYTDEYIVRQIGEGMNRFVGRSEYMNLPMIDSGFKALIVGPSQSVYEAPEYRELYVSGQTTDTFTRKSIKATEVPGNFDGDITFVKPYIVGTSDDIMRHYSPLKADGKPATGNADSARPREDFFYFGEAFFDMYYHLGIVEGCPRFPLSYFNQPDDYRYDLHILDAYEKAQAAGLWPGTKMMESVKDYYVYGALAFWEMIPESQAFAKKSFPVNTRAEMYEYDYPLYWALSGAHGKYEFWTGVGAGQALNSSNDSGKYNTPWFWHNQPDNYGLPATANGTVGVPYEPLKIEAVTIVSENTVDVLFNREVKTVAPIGQASNWRVYIGGTAVAASAITQPSGYNFKRIRLRTNFTHNWSTGAETNVANRLDNGKPYGRYFAGFNQADLDERSVANGGWIANNQVLGSAPLAFGQFVGLDEAISQYGAGPVGKVEVEYIGADATDWDGNVLAKNQRYEASFRPWVGNTYRTPLAGCYIYLDSNVATEDFYMYTRKGLASTITAKDVAMAAAQKYETQLTNNQNVTYPTSAGGDAFDYAFAVGSGSRTTTHAGAGQTSTYTWNNGTVTYSGQNIRNVPVTYDRVGQRIADGAVRGGGGMIIAAGSVLGNHPGMQPQSNGLSGNLADSLRVEGWGGTTFQTEDVLIVRDYNLCRYKNESLVYHEGGHGVDSFTNGTANYAQNVYNDITAAWATAVSYANGAKYHDVDGIGAYMSVRGEYVSTWSPWYAGGGRESFQGINDGTWTPIAYREEAYRYDPWGGEAFTRAYFGGELGLWYENKIGDPAYRVMPEDWELLRDQNPQFSHWTSVNNLVAWGFSIPPTAQHNPYTGADNPLVRWISWTSPSVWNIEPYGVPSNPAFPNNRFDFAGRSAYHPEPDGKSPIKVETHPFLEGGGVQRPARPASFAALVAPVSGTVTAGTAAIQSRPVLVTFEFKDYSGEITKNNAQTSFELKVNGKLMHFYFWSFKEATPGLANVTLRLDWPLVAGDTLEVVALGSAPQPVPELVEEIEEIIEIDLDYLVEVDNTNPLEIEPVIE